jgi:flavin-binding protein dodecin
MVSKTKNWRGDMPNSVYKIIELVGSSPTSWEEAVNNAVKETAASLRDLRICEVEKLDTKIEDGKIVAYRARIKLSFKYQKE